MSTKFVSKEEVSPKRESAQRMSFKQIAELLQRNVAKNLNKTYTQYTQENVKTYLQSPANNLDNIREVSRFLERNSTLYKKILTYYAATPLFRYNIIQTNDLMKDFDVDKSKKKYFDVIKHMNGMDIKKEMYSAIYATVRDGMYVGFNYDDGEHSFFMPLDIKYTRIYGKNEYGQWITYFDATYFSGDREAFVKGDENGEGTWDQVFIDGYNQYQDGGRDYQWFQLPPERTLTLISCSDDNFDVPLPLMVGIFVQLMQIEDLLALLASQDELSNYKLLVSKIPIIKDSDDVDDFSLSLELATSFNDNINAELPELVSAVVSPMDMEVITFNKANSTEDTDRVNESIQNLFDNAGLSQLVVAGGSSTNSVGLKHSLQNDMSNVWVFVDRIESWLNYFMAENIGAGCQLTFHPVSWYNEEDYVSRVKEAATLGSSALDYLTAIGMTPYQAIQKLNFENMLGIKELMVPLSSSYTASSKGGRPTEDVDDISESGVEAREKQKSGNEVE